MLTGGSAVRFQGADKASIEVAGVTLLEHVLGALAEVPDVVVVGDQVVTSRPVGFVREDPPGGGPAAGLLAGLAGFPRPPRLVVVLAVDMPLVTTATVRRLMLSAEEDGALLVDEDGRRQYLCAIYRGEALLEAAPPLEEQHGLSMREAGLGPPAGRGAGAAPGRRTTWTPGRTSSRCGSNSAAEPAVPWERDLGYVLRRHARRSRLGTVNLHDWIDELCDVLDIEVEVDEALILDLARDAAHNVERPAAPISTFLLGYAAAGFDGDPAEVERLAGLALPGSHRAGTSRPTSSSTRTTTSRSRPRSRSRSDSGLTGGLKRLPTPRRVAACAPSSHPTRVVPRP